MRYRRGGFRISVADVDSVAASAFDSFAASAYETASASGIGDDHYGDHRAPMMDTEIESLYLQRQHDIVLFGHQFFGLHDPIKNLMDIHLIHLIHLIQH